MSSDLLMDATEAWQQGANPCAKAGLLVEWVKHACKEWPERTEEIRVVSHSAMWQIGMCDFSEQIQQALIITGKR